MFINNKLYKTLLKKNTGLVLFGTFVSNNIVTLRWVSDDNMAPYLSSSGTTKDVVVVLRATQYHKNDIIMYLNPNTGRECFGRLSVFNTSEKIESVSNKLPSGHCWVENDNPRSEEHDSNTFGPVSSYTPYTST